MEPAGAAQNPKTKKILVIANNATTNWYDVFSSVTHVNIHGKPHTLVIEQASFDSIHLTGYSDNGGELVVDLSPERDPRPNTQQHKHRTFKPDFILVRNVLHSISSKDFRPLLYGAMFAGIPTLNTASSMYFHLERPVVYGALLEIQRRLGPAQFPLIQQYYYPNFRTMNITPQYPLVLKVAHVHSGLGKVRVKQHSEFEDLRSLVALHEDYCTAEHFYDGEFDIRIQKIGDHIRVLKRTGTGQWKTNEGTAMLEEVPLTEKYKLWIDEASKIHGGLDLCALDVLHTTSGEEYILELNDTSIGLSPEHEWQDSLKIRDLLLKRLVEFYEAKNQKKVENKEEQTDQKLALEVELMNFRNKNEELTRQIEQLSSESEDMRNQNNKLRSSITQLRKAKEQPFKSLLYSLLIAIPLSFLPYLLMK